MKLTETQMRRVEDALTFDPREERRALLDRTAVALADAPTLRRRIVQALGEGPDVSQLAIDRLLTGTDELNVNFLERGMIAADAVARVEVRNGESEIVGSATGFMISSRLFLTNHHVLPSADDAAQSWVHFRHEYDAFGNSVEACLFAFEPSTFFFTDTELDITVVAVAPETPDRRQLLARFGWLRLSASADTVLPGEWLSTVHHPGGRPKQIILRQNLLMRSRDAELWYGTETSWSSSGGPLFNDSWQVVGIHRGGTPARDRAGRVLTVDGRPFVDGEDEARVVWRAGVGTRASAIVLCLAARCGDHPLIQELLAQADADASLAIVLPLGAGAEPAIPPAALTPPADDQSRLAELADIVESNGAHPSEAVTVTVPLRITVRTGNGSGREPAVGVNLS
ncbi:MAG TPA: serine protease [Gemmatimonadaceae bacterium]|nr:serine protease [Gemmatimonadaceae bacterium]